MSKIQLKRIYDDPSVDDGFRMLVDRFWPRGIKKSDAKLDEWNKEIAPTIALRKWFDHDETKWQEFIQLYEAELLQNVVELHRLRAIAEQQTLTLLFAAKNVEMNQAQVILTVLNKKNGTIK